MNARDKLEQEAEAIQQLAELLAIKAEANFGEWHRRFDPTGPTEETDEFSDLKRSPFSLELEDLIEEP